MAYVSVPQSGVLRNGTCNVSGTDTDMLINRGKNPNHERSENII